MLKLLHACGILSPCLHLSVNASVKTTTTSWWSTMKESANKTLMAKTLQIAMIILQVTSTNPNCALVSYLSVRLMSHLNAKMDMTLAQSILVNAFLSKTQMRFILLLNFLALTVMVKSTMNQNQIVDAKVTQLAGATTMNSVNVSVMALNVKSHAKEILHSTLFPSVVV